MRSLIVGKHDTLIVHTDTNGAQTTAHTHLYSHITLSKQICLLPCSIQVARKLCVFNELSLVDALLHSLSGWEVVVWNMQHPLMNLLPPRKCAQWGKNNLRGRGAMQIKWSAHHNLMKDEGWPIYTTMCNIKVNTDKMKANPGTKANLSEYVILAGCYFFSHQPVYWHAADVNR